MMCKICGNGSKNRCLLVKEMLYGTRDVFTYLECSNCGCLQIIDPPADIQHYYPEAYHAEKPSRVMDSVIRNLLKKREKYLLFKKGILGRMVRAEYPNALLQFMGKAPMSMAIFELLGKASINTNLRILDVGCGSGLLLDHLRNLGFTDLMGIDPYAKVTPDSGVKILNKTIEDLADNERFDVIMFNHSLEHIPNQLGALRKASKLLNQDGLCIVRMPIKAEYFWNRYGVCWYQIDAPRHNTIHTSNSFELLTAKTDLTLRRVEFDTDWFSIASSERYLKDTHIEPTNPKVVSKKSTFTANQLIEFKKLEKELNHTGRGDQAAFCLRKS